MAVLGAVWAGRLPLGEFIIKQQFDAPGAPAQLRLTRLDFGGVEARDIVLGGQAPDFTARSVAADFAWRGFSLGVSAITAEQPALRVKINDKGVSLGVLDGMMKSGGADNAPASLPDWTVDVRNAAVIFDTPLGLATATGQAKGALRRDFSLAMRLPQTNTRGPQGSIEGLAGDLSARTQGGLVALQFNAAATAASWADGGIATPRAQLVVNTNADLKNTQIDASAGAARAQIAGHAIVAPAAQAHVEPTGGTWTGRLNAALQSIAGANVNAGAAKLEAFANGGDGKFSGALTAEAARAGAYGLSLRETKLSGPLSGDYAGPLSVTTRADFSAAEAAFSASARRDIVSTLPILGGTPFDPLMRGARGGLDRALQRFAIAAPLSFSWADKQGRLTAPGSATLTATSGTKITVTPLSQTRPAFGIALPAGALDGAAKIVTAGGGLPQAEFSVSRFARDEKGLALDGALTIADWRASGASARSGPLAVKVTQSSAEVRGAATITGPLAGMRLVDAQLPLNLAARFGKTWDVKQNGGCLDIRAARLEAFGLQFANAALPLCPAGPAFAAGDEKGALSGGFTITPPVLSGRMDGAVVRPARLALASINGKLGGTLDALALDTTIAAPNLTIDWDKTRRVNLRGQRVTANLRTNAQGWRVDGALSDIRVEDNTAPARLEAFNASWRAAPRGDDVVITFANGAGRVFDWHDKTVISPLRVTGVAGTLENGQARAAGKINLEKTGAALGEFDLTHELESGAGRAQARARDLTFVPGGLQPYDVSETIVGVVDNVAGPIDADFNARWAEDFAVTARVDLKSLNIATAALGPTEAIIGEINFSDFLTLSTPPGQIIRAGRINPGVPVTDGAVRFQMLPDLNLKLEDARWPFAGGTLSVLPTTIPLTAEEMRLTLALGKVDVAKLTEQLNIKGLTATGEVQGQFPLIFADGKGRIAGGRLVAGPAGGVIQYDTDLGAAGGPAKIAFGALQSFNYDTLTIDIDGALDGELVSKIAFSGVNREPVDQPAGPATIKIVGIPFKFNVTVTAPFMALARTAGSFTDAGSVINQAPPADVKVDVQAEQQSPP